MERELTLPSYRTLFATRGNIRRMRVIIALGFVSPPAEVRLYVLMNIEQFSQWSGNGLGSYYMNLILEQAGIQQASIKTLINAVLQVSLKKFSRTRLTMHVNQLFNYFMALTSALFVDRIGRRTLFLISNCGMLVCKSLAHLMTTS